MYRANWERACIGVITASTFVVISSVLVVVFDMSLFIGFVLAASLFIWLLVVVIVLFHSASSLTISKGVVTQLRFGGRGHSIPLSELVELEILTAMYPGILRFRDGTEFHVSGIAVGQDDGLVRFVEQHAPDVRITQSE